MEKMGLFKNRLFIEIVLIKASCNILKIFVLNLDKNYNIMHFQSHTHYILRTIFCVNIFKIKRNLISVTSYMCSDICVCVVIMYIIM